jgi:hypothetical protein
MPNVRAKAGADGGLPGLGQGKCAMTVKFAAALGVLVSLHCVFRVDIQSL